jgi:hypothetical protein
VFILYSTKFLICYWSEHCMLQPSLWFVTCQNVVCYDQVYDLFLVRMPYVTISNSYIQIDCCVHIVFDQVDDLFLVRTLYVMTKFMICYWSERCMLLPSLWFVSGQNTVWYDQVYDLLLVRTLYGTTKFMICYRSKHCMVRPSLWFVTGQNTVFYDQVYYMLLFRTPYVTKSNSYI